MVRLSQTILTALPSEPKTIGMETLCSTAGVTRQQVTCAIGKLIDRGLATSPKRSQYQRTEMGDRVCADGREIKSGPRPGSKGKQSLRPSDAKGHSDLRDRAWKALRMLRKATIPEMLELSSSGDERDPHTNVRKYLKALCQRGIVSRLARRTAGMAVTSNGFHQYLLIRDLGPKAPLWRTAADQVVDRNSGEIIERIEENLK